MKERPDRRYTSDELLTGVSSIHSSIPSEGRSAEEYLRQLSIGREDLENKHVLELGAGAELNFARDIAKLGIKADVVSFSPAFLNAKLWKEYWRAVDSEKASERVVTGMAEHLPFADNSFDTVVMFYVNFYINSDQRMDDCLSEITRVLKPGGRAFIGPLLSPSKDEAGIDRNKRWFDESKVKNSLGDKASALWEEAPNTPSGAEARTLKLVKNES